MLFLTSTGFDCVLAFDLRKKEFTWGFHLIQSLNDWGGFAFDPMSSDGPQAVNEQHVNMVYVDKTGLYLSGLKTKAMLRVDNANTVHQVCNLPVGTHNARPYKKGIIFNDTANDVVRVIPRAGKPRVFTIAHYNPADLEFADIDDSKVARQGFARGLCPVGDRFVAVGSSPSTITLFDIVTGATVASVNLTKDIRNAVHGLEVWPFGVF
jgi:hypothetical protein